MEIQQFENDIITIKNRIKKMEPIVEKNSTLFHSKAEVEGLYDSLSRYAGAYGLVISKIQKQKPQPVLKSGVAAQAQELLDQSMVSYYKIPVDYEIKGNFLNYIKFISLWSINYSFCRCNFYLRRIINILFFHLREICI